MSDLRPMPITELLSAARHGDKAALQELMSAVYNELRLIARRQLSAEAAGRTMQPTALVNEAYLRVFGDNQPDFANRRFFFATFAKIMRQIRVDDARKRNRLKRGGGRKPASLDDGVVPTSESPFGDDPAELLAIHDALTRLEETDPRTARVVELRFFGGMTREDIAQEIAISPRTVDNLWTFGRAWLRKELSND